MSECGAGCQGKEDKFRRNSSAKQRFTIPESSITLPESAPNFRDEFAVDSPLQRRVSCEPRSRRSAQAASVAIDLSDAEAISLMSVAVLLFSLMVVLALTNRFRLVLRLSQGITLLVKLSFL